MKAFHANVRLNSEEMGEYPVGNAGFLTQKLVAARSSVVDTAVCCRVSGHSKQYNNIIMADDLKRVAVIQPNSFGKQGWVTSLC